ncbi:MAG: hypothetical protein ACI9YT_000888 [Halobacteriales archaeon]|jgi:hypothetical protein
MVAINETTLGLTFAVLGVVFSVVWLVLGLYGINTLRELRDALRESTENEA